MTTGRLSIGGYLVLMVVALFMALPLLAMVSTSLKADHAVFTTPFAWMPDPVCWDNYIRVMAKYPFTGYFNNSLIVSGVATVINLFLSSLAGYSLAKFDYRGRTFLFSTVILLLLLPSQAMVVPLFMAMSFLHLTDSLWAVILPSMSSPFAIFLMRQYFLSIPNSIIEAARVDGATEWQIYLKIILPQAKPVLAALGIFSFMYNWNNFLWPLIALKTEGKFTLPLGIAMMQGEYSTPYTELMAAAVIASLPVLLVYAVLQNRFIRGMVLFSVPYGNTASNGKAD